jgi:hypothetical protein
MPARFAPLAIGLTALALPAAAHPPGWTVDTCYTRAQLSEEAARPGVESKVGLEPQISPGVTMDTRDDDTESPFYDKTLDWKLRTFAQMMTPGGFTAMTADHAKSAGETLEEAQTALTTERSLLWFDLRTNGIRLKIAALFRDPATGQTAKLLSDDLPDTGEPTKFCVVSVQ